MAEVSVTQLLQSMDSDNALATQEILPIVYQELRALAGRQMRQEPHGHTLQATALVHEAFIKLTGGERISWANRRHFFAAAAEAMRRILIDHARQKRRDKRGGGRQQVTLNEDVISNADEDGVDILALSDALDRLGAQDARMAEIVKLRYFAGLSVGETAQAIDISERSVNRQWTAARAWLLRAMSEPPGEEGSTAQ